MNLKGKIVAVTGAGGSIGSEICRQAIKADAQRLVPVCLTESALYGLLKSLPAGRTKITPILGSVNDDRLMAEAFDHCNLVVHTAAHKHVDICEAHPLAAIENNIRGTYIAMQAAESAGVDVFVLISTDKAVLPMSVYGATKRVGELMVRDMYANARTKFVACRFGNVLDSAGSVLPLWRRQLREGFPITLTSPDCERYFMAIPEAVELVLTCAGFEAGGPYIFDMGKPHNMGDLARKIIREVRPDVKDPDSMIKVTGLRPGEKVIEVLTYGGKLDATRHPKIFRVAPDFTQPLTAKKLNDLLASVRERDVTDSLKRLWEIVK